MNSNLEQTLNFRKQQVDAVVRQRGIDGVMAKVALVLDFSYSMNDLYRSGAVQRTLERIVPIAESMDSDGELDVYIFHNQAYRIGTVSRNNLTNYVANEIYSKHKMGGTSYAPAMDMIRRQYGFGRNNPEPQKSSGGMFSRLFGGGSSATQTEPEISFAKEPVLVYFITDGNNDPQDKEAAEKAIRNSAYEPIFWQYIGIGSEQFQFLQKLDDLSGRFIDNADFQKVTDLDQISDDVLYDRLLTEYPGWVKGAQNKGLIR